MGEVIYPGRDEMDDENDGGLYLEAKRLYLQDRRDGEPQWMELNRRERLHYYRIAFNNARAPSLQQ